MKTQICIRPVLVLLLFALVFAANSKAYAAQSGSTGSASKGSATRGSAIRGSTPGSAARPIQQGSSTTATAQSGSEGMSEEAKAFRDLQIQLKTNQDRIDFLLRTIPIGFPERRKAHKAEIDRLTKANEQLKGQVYAKAKAAFRASEKPSLQSTKIVTSRLDSMLKPRDIEDVFDPEAALELIVMLKDKFPASFQVLEYEFLANYAIERFENAEQALNQIEQLANKNSAGREEQLATFRQGLKNRRKELRSTMDKYQQELMIRRLESNTDDLPRVLLVTSEGDILIELYENHAPNTVANFIHLVRDQKFYDGKLFHLVLPGQYAMSGSPTGDGRGNAGYRIKCECYGETIRSHFRGTLTMISPEKDRGGSQFFITQQPNPHTFDGKYTAFGRVIEGLDVVYKLNSVDMTTGLASANNVSKIIRAEVVRSRSHTYMPEKIAVQKGLSDPGSGTRNPALPEDEVDTPGSFDLLLQGEDGGK